MGLEDLQIELRKEAELKNQPQQAEVKKEEVKVEEKVEEVKEEVKETPEVKVEVKEEEKVEEAPTLSERAQARIDGLIERQIEKDKKIAELEKKLETVKPEPKADPEFTKEQLLNFLADDNLTAGQRAWVTDKLTDLKVEEKLGKFQETAKFETAQASSYERAKVDFPEMADIKSEFWQKANEIYLRKNLKHDPDGQYTAAALAKVELDKKIVKTETSQEILQKRLDKEAGKKGLATVSKKTVISTDDILQKLEKEATGKKPGSPEWNKYLAEMERIRLAKKNK